jgi:ADP-ribose pyrophosphatase YjhB (NUDIX family)
MHSNEILPQAQSFPHILSNEDKCTLEIFLMKNRQIYWHINEHNQMEEDSFKYCPFCGKLLVQKIVDKHLRRTCPNCGFVHFRNPAPTVSLLIVDGDLILLGKRSVHLGKDSWATPSGYIEYNEDFLTTAVREAKEETSLDIEIISILNVTDSIFPPDQHFLNIYLLARVIGGQLWADDDMDEIRWFPLIGPLPEMAFQEDVDIIEHYRKASDQFLPIE